MALLGSTLQSPNVTQVDLVHRKQPGLKVPTLRAVTAIDELCGSLSRDGSGKACYNLRKLRKAGIRSETVPAALKELVVALGSGCEEKLISSQEFDLVVNVLYFLRSLIEVLLDSSDIMLTSTLADYDSISWVLLDMSAVEQVQAMKYWLSWPMARWLRDPHIAGEEPEHLKKEKYFQWLGTGLFRFPVRGVVRKHMKNMIASNTRSVPAAELCLGLLQGVKRGCAPVSEAFQLVSCIKHKTALSQDIPFDYEEEFGEKFYQIFAKESGDSTVYSTSGGDKWKKKLEPRTFIRKLWNPSSRASYDSLRSEGGRAGEIFRHLIRRDERKINFEDIPDVGQLDPVSGGLKVAPFDKEGAIKETLDALSLIIKKKKPLGNFRKLVEEDLNSEKTNLSELRTLLKTGRWSLGGGSREGFCASHEGGLYDNTLLDELQMPFLDMIEIAPGVTVTRYGFPLPTYEYVLRKILKDFPEDTPLRAKVALCLEPLKCRVITKGESFPYWFSQAFQKASRDCLLDTPAFCLTGVPVDGSHVWGLEKQTKDLGLAFDKWVSGDYSAATDGLSLRANQKCLAVLLSCLGATSEERRVCRQVLGAHEIFYPEHLEYDSNDQLDPFVMTNGQLMGSLLSFPVLCAINLTAYWLALEEFTGRTFRREELPCLVNGDDILFKASDAFYEVWKKWVARAGFTLSPGKNYISPNFLTVNSEAWLYKPCDGKPQFRKLRYLNAGLLMFEAQGPKRPAMRTETAEAPFVEKMQFCLDNSINPRRTFRRLKHHYKGKIEIFSRWKRRWDRKSQRWVTVDPGFYNLCVPTELGGLGLKIPEELRDEVHITPAQQRLAGRSNHWWKSTGFINPAPRNPNIRVSTVFDQMRPIDTTFPIPYPLISRDKTEPLRENEVRVSDVTASRRNGRPLFNCQNPSAGDQPHYVIRDIDTRHIRNKKRKGNCPVIKRPFDFHLEFRVNKAPVTPSDPEKDEGPTDEASLESDWFTPDPVLPKMAEMATGSADTPLYRTDSWTVDPVHSPYVTPSSWKASLPDYVLGLIQDFTTPTWLRNTGTGCMPLNPRFDRMARYFFGDIDLRQVAFQPWVKGHDHSFVEPFDDRWQSRSDRTRMSILSNY